MMIRLLTDRVTVKTPTEWLWSLFYNVQALRRILPGCESLDEVAAGAYQGIVAARIQFVTLRANARARLSDVEPPNRLRLELEGHPLGIAGSFVVSIPMELQPVLAGTEISYSVDFHTTGRLATFGAPLLRETMRRQVDQLIANLEHEYAEVAGTAGKETAE